MSEKQCFTCGENARNILNIYKKIYETTNESYYFFKDKKGRINVTTAEDFKKIKKSKYTEYAHISEYK